MFKTREHAGKLLAQKIELELKKNIPNLGNDILVVGLPRGGVPVAKEIALMLNAPLTILASKKIGAPDQPELAIGAVSSSGVVVFNKELFPYILQMKKYVENKICELTNTTKQLEERLLKQAGLDVSQTYSGKIVIIVDDGVATGMTTEAALKSARKLGARYIVLATPVISPMTEKKLEQDFDLLITLLMPENFMSVGQFYEDFHQMDDLEVVDVLHEAAISRNAYVNR
jgi:predicted phosphoribosyltransferase